MPKTISDDETSPWQIDDSGWTWTLKSSGSLSVDGTAIVEDSSRSHNNIAIQGDIHSDTEQEGSVAMNSAGFATSVDIAASALVDTENGFVFSGGKQQLTNSGLIHVDDTGINGSVDVDNKGEITGTDALDVGNSSIVNEKGALIHGSDAGIEGYGYDWGLAPVAITNYGTISGDTDAIVTGHNVTTHLDNRGAIIGDVDLGDGADRLNFFAKSRVTGNVDAGAGEDFIIVSHGATFTGSISGGDGNDHYELINGRDKAQITETADGGSDTVYASFSYTLPDNVENLYLTGAKSMMGTGNDSDNIIYGDRGHDTLVGGGGADLLMNLHGHNDVLVGGSGDDTFAFNSHRSEVQDFVHGEDVLAFSDSKKIVSFENVTIEQHGDDTWIGYTAHSVFHLRVILDDFDASTLTSDDFEYHFTHHMI